MGWLHWPVGGIGLGIFDLGRGWLTAAPTRQRRHGHDPNNNISGIPPTGPPTYQNIT